jgi:hypothetical protein
MKIIPTKIHALLDYVVALCIMAAPWVFNFDDQGSATWVLVASGTATIGHSLMTEYEYSLANAIPFSTHLLLDTFSGLAVASSPWLFGFTFTKDKVEPKQIKKDSSSFKDLKKDLMPLQINRVEINHGIIKYKDEFSKPKVDIALTNAYVLASNLRNSYDSSAILPAALRATADVYEGKFELNVKINPLAEEPTFDLNAEVKNTNLVKLNEFFQAYAKVDVNKGTFGLYSEVAAKEGKFKGYVKPLIKRSGCPGQRRPRRQHLSQGLGRDRRRRGRSFSKPI